MYARHNLIIGPAYLWLEDVNSIKFSSFQLHSVNFDQIRFCRWQAAAETRELQQAQAEARAKRDALSALNAARETQQAYRILAQVWRC